MENGEIYKKQKEKETNNEKNQNIEKTIKIMKHAET